MNLYKRIIVLLLLSVALVFPYTKKLPINDVHQGETKLCWAYCAFAVLNYYENNASFHDIVNYGTEGKDVGNTLTGSGTQSLPNGAGTYKYNGVDRCLEKFSSKENKLKSQYFKGRESLENIVKSISKGSPYIIEQTIQLWYLTHAQDIGGHATIIKGVDYLGEQKNFVYVEDPSDSDFKGNYNWLKCHSVGIDPLTQKNKMASWTGTLKILNEKDPDKFNVTIKNGTRSKTLQCETDEIIHIEAVDTSIGQIFDHWEIVNEDSISGDIFDPSSSNTSFKVDLSDVTIQAVYKDSEDSTYKMVFDDFETTNRTWRLAGDFLKGWGIVGPGNSSHTISRIEKENPLDSNSTKILKWQSKLGTKDIIAINKDTNEKGISEYRFTQINTTPNMRGCDGISFQIKSNKNVKVEIVASPAYAQIYNASIIAGPSWTTHTIPFKSFTPNDYWVPDNPVMQPGKIQVIGFEVAGTGVTYDIEIDNIELYSNTKIHRRVKAQSGANGKITSAHSRTRVLEDSVEVPAGGYYKVNIVPDSGYQVFDVIVDGNHCGPITSYSFKDINDDHTIEASFVSDSLNIWTISTPDSIAMNVFPHGTVSVLEGGEQKFDFFPYSHMRVKDVIVNEVPQGPSTSYTFTNVIGYQDLDVKFELIQWDVTINTDENIDADPSGIQLVTDSTGFMVNFAPKSMYTIKDVVVNGVSQGAITEYIIPSVNMDYTIEVTSKPNLLIEDAEDGDNHTNGGGWWFAYGDHLMPTPNIPGNSASSISNLVDADISGNRNMVWDFKLGDVQAKNEDGNDIGNWVGCGFGLAQFNLKGYKGITFRAKASGRFDGTVYLKCKETPYIKNISFDKDWQTYTILFNECTVSPWAPEPITSFSDELINMIGVEFNDFKYKGIDLQIAFDDIQAFTDSNVNIITAEAENGIIYPHGKNAVIEGYSQKYIIQTPANALLTDIEVNGSSEGAIEEYTFNNVTSDQTIKALFDLPTYTLTASKTGEGTVSYLGDTTLSRGDSITYSFVAAEGYTLTDVVIDGESKGAISSYHFDNVVKSSTIEVTFTQDAVWNITTTTDGKGTVTPGDTTVANGSTITVTITPDAHYMIEDVLLNGVSQGVVTSLLLENISANQNVIAKFVPIMWDITVTAGENGTITPGDTSVFDGSLAYFTIIPDSHYQIEDVFVDGVSQGAISKLNIENVTANHVVTATFAPIMWDISTTAGENGSITPADTSVVDGSDINIFITPDPHYQIVDVLLDGISQGTDSIIIIENVTANHTVSATFAQIMWNITATAGENGTITPVDISVIDGGTATVMITPNVHYQIVDVLLDGVSQGAVTSLLLENVSANHTVSATFAPIMWDITVTQAENGTITPADTTVIDGSSISFTIIPDSNYITLDVLVDGVSQGPIETYLFESVTDHSSITAVFDIDTPLEFENEEKYSGIISVCPSIITIDDEQGIKFFYNSDEASDIEVVIFDKIGGVIYQNIHNNIKGNSQHFSEYQIDRVLEKGTYLAVFKISQKNKAILVKKQIGIKK